MPRRTARKTLAAGWRSVREAGPQRLAATGLLLIAALLLARYSWFLPFTNEAEQRLYDARAYMLAEEVDQDERILMVVYTDQTLIDLEKRSPLDRGMLAAALRNLDLMGANAIGIDILFDQKQAEDEELIATLRAMQTPVAVGSAQFTSNSAAIRYEQDSFLKSFLARLEGSNARPASVRLDDAYGITRRWPPEISGEPPVLGRVMLEDAGEGGKTLPGYDGAIRYRLPFRSSGVDAAEAGEQMQPIYAELDISLFADPAIAPAMAPMVQDRYVLIGGDLVDFDRVPTAFTSIEGTSPPGLAVHADLIAQMLDGARLKKVSEGMKWALAVLTILMAMLTALLELRSWKLLPLLLTQLALIIGLPFWLQAQGSDTYLLPAIGPALGWIFAFAAVTSTARAATAVQRQFAQGALGKYLPASIAEEIIEHPELLGLHGEKRQLYMLFSDLEGFTKMSNSLDPEMVARLLNRYLELLSNVVLSHGGILDKFVGDAVVAFWGAPISRTDDGERAAKAGYAVWQAGEQFREEVAALYPDLPRVGKTRVGLHYGNAVVGNFGGENRIQYTALGDSMNTAARLESANKSLKTSVMASAEFARRSGLNWWRRMGAVVLSGRAQPLDLCEPAPDFPDTDRIELNEAVTALPAERDAATARIAAIAARHPDDSGLQALLERCADLDENGAYVMHGK